MGHLKQEKFGNPIFMDCQEALNPIPRVSLKSVLQLDCRVRKEAGGEIWLLHSCPPTQPPSGGEETSTDPQSQECETSTREETKERKPRKFSGSRMAVRLLIIQSYS